MSFDTLKSRVSAYVENNFPDINGGSGGGESDGSGSKAGVGLEALVFLYVAMVYESGRTPEPLHLEVTSKIPVGAGLGSSAAYSVAVATVFYRHLVLNQEAVNRSCLYFNSI